MLFQFHWDNHCRYRCLAGRMAMHACQIGPIDTAPPCPGSPLRACIVTKGGTLWGTQPFCPPFLLHYSSVRTMRLHSPSVLGSIRISGLGGKLAAGFLRSRLAWIVFCFHCWVADDKNGGDGDVRHCCWVVAAMGHPCHSRAISILRRIVRATKAAT